jgi:hypothetical protein
LRSTDRQRSRGQGLNFKEYIPPSFHVSPACSEDLRVVRPQRLSNTLCSISPMRSPNQQGFMGYMFHGRQIPDSTQWTLRRLCFCRLELGISNGKGTEHAVLGQSHVLCRGTVTWVRSRQPHNSCSGTQTYLPLPS